MIWQFSHLRLIDALTFMILSLCLCFSSSIHTNTFHRKVQHAHVGMKQERDSLPYTREDLYYTPSFLFFKSFFLKKKFFFIFFHPVCIFSKPIYIKKQKNDEQSEPFL